MIISFEGIDGCGKTTQIKLLYEYLRKKYDVITTEEPTKNNIGLIIKKYLKENAQNWIMALLFAADRAVHYKEVLLPNINKIILCDRYIHSSLAYQPSVGLEEEWIKSLNRYFPNPDLVIYIDVMPETAIKRIKKRGSDFEEFEKLNLLRKVRENYLKMESNNFILIDGERSIKEIQKDIREVVDDFVRQRY